MTGLFHARHAWLETSGCAKCITSIPMKLPFLALLLAASLSVAAEPAKETAPATPEPKPFFDPNAPAPTVDPTIPVPEPDLPTPEKKKSAVPERKKKEKK